MDSGMEVGECNSCGEIRRLASIPVEVIDIDLIMMVKSITQTGMRAEYLLCGACAEKVRVGSLKVTRDGVFMTDSGRHYRTVLKEEKDRNVRLW